MLSKTIFVLFVAFISNVASQDAGSHSQCVCYDPDEEMHVTSAPITGNNDTNTHIVVIALPGGIDVSKQVNYTDISLPPNYEPVYEQATSPVIAQTQITVNELRERNAPPPITDEVERIGNTIIEVLNSGKNLQTQEEFDSWNFRVEVVVRKAIRDLSKLAESPDAVQYIFYIRILIMQYSVVGNFLEQSTDSSQCIYEEQTYSPQ